MTYSEAMEETELTPAQVRRELHKHRLDWAEFVAEVGLEATYTGAEVLGWMGY